MSLVPFEGAIEGLEGILNKFIPDTAARDAAKAQIATLFIQTAAQSDAAQNQVNQAEASNENLFVSGARPFILWVCGLAFAGHYVLLPSFMFLHSCWYGACTSPAFDIAELNSVLYALLGVGSLRTVDKSIGYVMKALK